jgi:phosphoglycolate phosphatase
LRQAGKPVKEIFRSLFGDITEKQSAALLKETRNQICEMINADKGYIYEGMPAVISELSKQYKLSVCSNAGIRYIDTILEHYSLKNYFEPVLTLETIGVKDKNELLKAYILNSKTDSNNWVMVGDRKMDLDAARYNYVSFIGCLWGHGETEELEGANVLLERPESLLSAIKKVLKY